ncbi:MAG: phosphotransferase, partial [Cytophagales bacterium]|nr:phosphotransferase [Cytophagales bacterium]
ASFLPRMKELRRSIIHNDANASNIIVNAGDSDGTWQIGFIDFFDMIHSCTIFELAICLAYLMALHPKPFQIAKALLSAYHEEFPISPLEIEVLPTLIKARLATSVALSAQKRHEEPENEYLFINEESGWILLETLSALDSESFTCILKSACDTK